MSRRIDIELTSKNDDSWTWRAVGAREPKGVIAAGLVPDSASIGDELRVEADFFVDGIEIVNVLPPKGARKEPDFIEILGSGRDQGGVTTSLVPKGGRGRREGGGGRGRGRREDGDNRGGGRQDKRGDRSGGRGRGSRPDDRGGRNERPERPAPPAKPKPKRLRPRRTHRDAALAALPEEQRPIADQVLRGGIPGVRKAVEDQNARNKAEGRPEIAPAPLVQLAESILPPLKEAEWRDRAEAALAGIDDLDLRDLRSVVVAAESATRSDETRSLATQLTDAVAARVDKDQAQWLADITEALNDDRTVRALRMSSRPPKAGAPLPPEVSTRLVEAANAALSDDTGPQRWGTVLDAVAYAPIRQTVTPAGIPGRPNDELLETVKRLSTRVPQIAALFGIEPQEAPRKRRRSRGGTGRGPKKSTGAAPKTGARKPEAEPASTPKVDDSPAPAPEAEAPAATTDAAAPTEAPQPVPTSAEDSSVVEEPATAEPDPVPEAASEGGAAEEPASDAEVSDAAASDEGATEA